MASETRLISQAEQDDLVRQAVHVGPPCGDCLDVPRGHVHTTKKRIHVPVEKEVKVPVIKREVNRGVEKQVLRGKNMIPVKKYRDVKETVLETREEVVHGHKEVWKKFREPTREVVKKAVPVTRTKRVAYIDYVPKQVEKVIEVPRDEIVEKKGVRVDKHVGRKIVEVEEEHHYEMRPVLVRKGETRMRECGYEHHGKTAHGKSYWDELQHEYLVRSRSEPPLEPRTQRFDPAPRSKSVRRRRPASPKR
mmetsp:Transcript_16754/g.41789  ORF Transcript_16754/g.41789 Transcript_16754/m.41789 type:complete len:249 (+) Transcript_16754:102-848(+)